MPPSFKAIALRTVDRIPPALVPRRVRARRLAAHRGTLVRARREGRLVQQVRSAEFVLRYAPEDTGAQTALAYARDARALLTTGFPLPPAAGAPLYEPDPGSVLAVLSQSLPHRSGGYATRSHGVLTALRRRGWDVAAITRLGFPYFRWRADDPRVVSAEDVIDGVPYVRALDERRRYAQHPLRAYVEEFADHVERAARERRAAVIHASSFYQTGLSAALAARRLGVPFVYEMRGLEDLMRSAEERRHRWSPNHDFLARMELEVCLAADKVLVITEALRGEMIRRGVPADKIAVLPNGVHAADFDPRPRDKELAETLGIGDRTVIGYAGSIVHYEGLDVLMDAVAVLRRRRGDDFVVLIVGDGAAKSRIERRCRKRGLRSVVTFTGRVPHDEVPRYLSLFDITPFPRKRLDVCELISPMKPYEAMASARAVAVSDVAALVEIVRHEQTGLVFRADDAESLADTLERLIDDRQLRSDLGQAARAWVRDSGDWEQVSRVVDATYESLGLSATDTTPGPSDRGSIGDVVGDRA